MLPLLAAETDRLLAFGHRSRVPGGFARQADDGTALEGPRELWIACRMTHVYALGHLLGHAGSEDLVDHGVRSLRAAFRDAEHGGWFPAVAADGVPVDTTKAAYPHAFVVLAATSAATAGHPDAPGLLAEALDVSERRFWDEAAGMVVEEWDRAFTTLDPYRGVNAAMHTVEAYLAAADVTGEDRWLDRALRMVDRVAHHLAPAHDGRIPEHFDADWSPQPDYNADRPADPFRPFGSTVGHGLEWARLTLHTRAALAARGQQPPGWMASAATALYDRAVADGWSVDGAPGFVYTVDWSGRPVVRQRFHWVAAEAVAAAAALHRATGEERFAHDLDRWWGYAADHLVDRRGGSWWHELDPANAVARTVWKEKADLYHAVQATLIPRLPLAPALAPALAAGLLDG
ncbi:AGE family epimerase/isomerase [Nocardioides sp. GY 10113]|nr:AGE family epimerase/isomerase [Nocardioides sp. GY 10113]